ncbi:MAG: hypothetical protein WED05_04980 [Candidatus Atabeyarchaeum deiterrae]
MRTMTTINEEQLLSAVKRVFAKAKKKFCKADKMVELLIEEDMTPQEANHAISLAEDKEEIQVCYPYVDDIRGERSYMLLTEEDREIEEELDEELLGIKGDL